MYKLHVIHNIDENSYYSKLLYHVDDNNKPHPVFLFDIHQETVMKYVSFEMAEVVMKEILDTPKWGHLNLEVLEYSGKPGEGYVSIFNSSNSETPNVPDL